MEAACFKSLFVPPNHHIFRYGESSYQGSDSDSTWYIITMLFVCKPTIRKHSDECLDSNMIPRNKQF